MVYMRERSDWPTVDCIRSYSCKTYIEVHEDFKVYNGVCTVLLEFQLFAEKGNVSTGLHRPCKDTCLSTMPPGMTVHSCLLSQAEMTRHWRAEQRTRG